MLRRIRRGFYSKTKTRITRMICNSLIPRFTDYLNCPHIFWFKFPDYNTCPFFKITRVQLLTLQFPLTWGSLVAQMVKNLPAMQETQFDPWVRKIPGSGRSPGEGNGNPLQYSCLGNPMDRAAWWATVHGVTKSQTRLSDLHLTSLYLQSSYCLTSPLFSQGE